MKTLLFENHLYRIKKETDRLLVCQRINKNGEDTGYNGKEIKKMLKCEIWRNSGTRIISKKRIVKNPIQLTLELTTEE